MNDSHPYEDYYESLESFRREILALRSKNAKLKGLIGALEQCIIDQRNGNDILASASWDKVVEIFTIIKGKCECGTPTSDNSDMPIICDFCLSENN